jgi:hypothetical protein
MTLSKEQVDFIADCAGVCPATVRRFLRGIDIWPRKRMAIESALRSPACAHLGWVLRRFGS